MRTDIIGISQLSINKIKVAERIRSTTLFHRKKVYLVSIKLLAEKPFTSFSEGMVKGEMRVEFQVMCFSVKGLISEGYGSSKDRVAFFNLFRLGLYLKQPATIKSSISERNVTTHG
jgi:hypothetical protein